MLAWLKKTAMPTSFPFQAQGLDVCYVWWGGAASCIWRCRSRWSSGLGVNVTQLSQEVLFLRLVSGQCSDRQTEDTRIQHHRRRRKQKRILLRMVKRESKEREQSDKESWKSKVKHFLSLDMCVCLPSLDSTRISNHL